jgi:phage terminase large subunit GpA-like protein
VRLCERNATTAATSRTIIERGDQREYYVPCPHCDEFQTLKFGGKDTLRTV